MDRFHELEVFMAVADAGSFSRAGKRLRLSPPAVTRAISALEERLGAQVFRRTTRSLTITDVGQRFLEGTRRILTDLDQAEKEAVGESATPHGHLVVTAPVTFGRLALMPHMRTFLNQNPRVTASVLLLDRVSSLVEEGVDVAIRIGHLPDSSLIATRLGDVRRVLVASPAYLARRGIPQAPADLRLHSMIAFTGLISNREWQYQDGRSTRSLSFMPRLEINDALASIAAAEAGEGITIALSYMVADRIRAGLLVAVLDEFSAPPVPVSLVYPKNRMISPKVRAFVDFVSPHLRSVLEELSISAS